MYLWSLWYSVFKQVDYFEPAQNIVHLKMIPRIDYTKKRGVLRVQADVSVFHQKLLCFLLFLCIVLV